MNTALMTEKMKTLFVDQGIPVDIGEFGANWRTISGTGESQQKHNASIQYHYRVVMEKAMQKGMVPVVWDTNYLNRPSMTIINRSGLSIYNQYMMNGVLEAMESVGIPVTAIGSTQVHRTPSDTLYDLQGRVLAEAPSHGIYIQDGRKMVK